MGATADRARELGSRKVGLVGGVALRISGRAGLGMCVGEPKVAAPGKMEQEGPKTVLRKAVAYGSFRNAGWVSQPLARLHRWPHCQHLQEAPGMDPTLLGVAVDKE